MSLNVAVPKETNPGERRVAVDPTVAERLAKLGLSMHVEKDAGGGAHIPDATYKSTTIVDSAGVLLSQADMILKVQPPTVAEVEQMKSGAVVVSLMMPHMHQDMVKRMRDRGVTSFALELIPRISRAQSMDVLSSQAAVAGYKAAIMGADLSTRFFPMLTTAAGTIRPAKVLVIGAGVAGLQAIATARRLGAMVEGYDVRAATKEQVQSLGAKFIEMDIKAEGAGGYARELTAEEKQKQQDILAKHVAQADVVISTAAIPGRPSPKIIPTSMVDGMKAGAVVVDLAAEGGGNCELSKPGETVHYGAVTIHAPLNVPSQTPFHASEMFAKNIYNFLEPMIKNSAFTPDWSDEIIAQSVLTHEGRIRHEPTRKLIEGN